MGFIQATKGSPCTHDIVFTNGRKERSGSMGSALDLGSKICQFKTQTSRNVVSLGKTLYPLLSNGLTQEERISSLHDYIC